MKASVYILGILLGSIVFLFSGTDIKAAELQKINIAAGSAIDHVTNFAALDMGIFKKYGLDAKITIFDSGVQIVSAIQSGNADVGTFGSVPMLISVSKGIPLRLIAFNHGSPNRKYYNDNAGIVANASSGIQKANIAGLAGKKIALPFGTAAEPYFFGLIEGAGVSRKAVTVMNVRPADLMMTLQHGIVDAVAIWEAFASTIAREVDGAVLVIRGNSRGWYDPGTAVTSQNTIDEKRDVLKRYLIAQAEIHQWVRDNLDSAAEIAIRWLPELKLEIAKSAIRAPLFDPRMSKLTFEGYDEITIPYLESKGKLKKVFPATEVIRADILVEVMNQYPKFFDDLQPILVENQLK